MYLQRNINEYEISKLTTKKGRITIPLFKMMAFVGIVDEDLLLEFERFIRVDPAADAFRSAVELLSDISPRGVKRKFTFELLIENNAQLLLAGYSLPPIVESAVDNQTPPQNKQVRVSGKKAFTQAYISRHSKPIQKKVEEILSTEIPSGNPYFSFNVKQDVLKRLNDKLPKSKDELSASSSAILHNIKQLIVSMRAHGRRDREQNSFMENIALAVWGDVPLATLESFTGLSRRMIEHGRDMRLKFNVDVEKASRVQTSTSSYVTPTQHNESDGSDSDSENESSDDESEMISSGGRKRRRRGEETVDENETRNNVFREYFSAKSRKLRRDNIEGSKVQLFCHYSPWGGRVDTLKLSRQQLLLEQPLGGFDYETPRVFQFPITEMHKQFIISEWGVAQREENRGRDLSLKKFRELICPCMSHAKQRDTADEIVAEFKHCLHTWDICMRKKDRNVRLEIARCSSTECSQHKGGSESAELYANASKTTSNFLSYLLCPQIQRDELAVKVMVGPSTFAAEMETAKSNNIAAAIRKKSSRDADFRASRATKSSTKKLKKERQEKALPTRSIDPGFGWYQKKCCELRCDDCGVKSRFQSGDAADISASSAADDAIAQFSATSCNCEFDCRDDNGQEIEVLVKVRMYKEHVRSGGFQKELEDVEMSLTDFKIHFMRCMKKYLKHHFNDIMSSQSRRNLYEKMKTDPSLSSTLILASDYSAILDGHSQDQLNQTVQLHSIQLVILLSHLLNGVLVTKAYSFWTQQGTSKLKSDNHYYRQCKNRVIDDARTANVPFDRVIEITDGAPTQFKNRFNVVQLADLVRRYSLVWAMAVYPPTATFKGEHDGVGNLDKNVIRKAELAETGRYPTTRSYMPLLLSQPAKTPRALDDIHRKTHEIDQHIRIYVVDKPNMLPGDDTNQNFLVTDKSNENYECSIVSGIQSTYNVIVFRNESETGEINKNQTVYLRDGFCSCDSCRKAVLPEDFSSCRYEKLICY